MKELIETYLTKAKAGDLAAAKFVLNFLTGGAPKVQVQKVMVVKRSKSTNRQAAAPSPVLRPRAEQSDEDLDEACRVNASDPAMIAPPAVKVLRKLAALFIKAEGPSQGPAIAAQLEVSPEDLEAVMKCDWFKLSRGVWDLTPAGRSGV